MIFETRTSEGPTCSDAEHLSLYNAYLDQRRAYKKEFCRSVLAVCPRGKVLEVNSGWGYTGIDLVKDSPGLSLHILANSPKVATLARANAKREGVIEQTTINQGGNEQMPYDDEFFDIVISTNSLHCWPNPELVIKEMYRVLCGNGTLYINDLRRDADEHIAEYIIREMQEDRSQFGKYSFNKFIDSWRSSYTLEEFDNILSSVGLKNYQISEDGAMTFTTTITKNI